MFSYLGFVHTCFVPSVHSKAKQRAGRSYPGSASGITTTSGWEQATDLADQESGSDLQVSFERSSLRGGSGKAGLGSEEHGCGDDGCDGELHFDCLVERICEDVKI